MTFKKVISFVLAFGFLLSVNRSAFAENMATSDANTSPLQDSIAISNAVNYYFDTRANFLLGRVSTFDWLVSGIVADEQVHKEYYAQTGIILEKSTYTISNIACYDTHAEAFVLETIEYTCGTTHSTDNIEHKVTLYLYNGNPIVAADSYIEDCTNFVSCSYVAPAQQTYTARTVTNAGGGGSCIVEIARAEIGTTETGDNITEYGEWFGWNGVAWCAIFVSWCANQVNVDTSIILKTANPLYMMNDFIAQDNFYYSETLGGTYTPQIGDILFIGTNPTNPAHVGIVADIVDNTLWVCDGNWSNKVSYHAYSLSSSDLIGYGHPAYETNGHHYTFEATDEMYHLGECDICGHSTDALEHHANITYGYNALFHWNECLDCGVEMNKTVHKLVLISVGEGYRCTVCGNRIYVTPITSVGDSLN